MIRVKSIQIVAFGNDVIATCDEPVLFSVADTGVERPHWVDPHGGTWSPEARERMTRLASIGGSKLALLDGREFEDVTVRVVWA